MKKRIHLFYFLLIFSSLVGCFGDSGGGSGANSKIPEGLPQNPGEAGKTRWRALIPTMMV